MARTELFVRNQPGGVFSVENMGASTGARLFVDSSTGTDGAGYGQNPDAPCATLDYAIGLCSASKGDIIYLMPGHAETITSTATCTLDVAGVKVQGLGWGPLRPTLTIAGATSAKISISAANCWIDNVRVISNFLNVAKSIDIAAGGTGTRLTNIAMRDTSIILGSLIGINVAAGVTDLYIDNLDYVQTALTAAATNIIKLAGATDRLRLTNSILFGACSGAVVDGSTAASVDIFLENIRLLNTDTGAGLGIAFHNSSAGYVNNVVGINLKNTVKAVTGTGLSYGPNCVYSNAVGAYAGLFDVAVDS